MGEVKMFVMPASKHDQAAKSLRWNQRPLITQVRLNAQQTITSNVDTNINWDTLVWDDMNGVWNIVDPQKIWVPRGITFGRVTIRSNWQRSNNNTARWNFAAYSGSGRVVGYGSAEVASGGGAGTLSTPNVCKSQWMPVAVGQYFYAVVNHNNPNPSIVYGPTGDGDGAPWLQVEWAF